ncbi:uncharacterized protein LOC143151276 [Ptiloglossa arizonensis]|uniref:uncharacterized protein LOC143151276 n=1 Tax=Ptiloglossa arizonensis TaxID=3350558 RepID=UPI003F9ECA82
MYNTEIKAKVNDPELLISRVKQLTNVDCIIIKQHDTFFKVSDGRLKLRQFEDGSGELIYYQRLNTCGPKVSIFEKTSLGADACVSIRNILSLSNGSLGTVKKTRKLYMIDQTRVHIDEIEGLGNFMELEAPSTNKQELESGEKIVRDIMTKLDIKRQDLIAEAYIDLLNKYTV